MPLTVACENQQARQIHGKGYGLPIAYQIGMSEFATSTNAAAQTALGTGGVGGCLIIVVHRMRGIGALGHYPGTPLVPDIIHGVRRMVQELGNGPVAEVLFAGGFTYGLVSPKQLQFEADVRAETQAILPAARVGWAAHPAEFMWGACYYLPHEEEVALFENDRAKYGEVIPTGIRSHSFR